MQVNYEISKIAAGALLQLIFFFGAICVQAVLDSYLCQGFRIPASAQGIPAPCTLA